MHPALKYILQIALGAFLQCIFFLASVVAVGGILSHKYDWISIAGAFLLFCSLSRAVGKYFWGITDAS